MSADQLEQLVTRIMGAAGGAAKPQGSAHAVGPMGACVLGIDKMKRPKVFMDWLKEAQAKIDYIGISEKKQIVAYGTDLLSMKQGDEIWMQFISELEDAADLCRLETQPLT